VTNYIEQHTIVAGFQETATIALVPRYCVGTS